MLLYKYSHSASSQKYHNLPLGPTSPSITNPGSPSSPFGPRWPFESYIQRLANKNLSSIACCHYCYALTHTWTCIVASNTRYTGVTHITLLTTEWCLAFWSTGTEETIQRNEEERNNTFISKKIDKNSRFWWLLTRNHRVRPFCRHDQRDHLDHGDLYYFVGEWERMSENCRDFPSQCSLQTLTYFTFRTTCSGRTSTTAGSVDVMKWNVE